MRVINPTEKIETQSGNMSVFLAGPCPRSDEGDWRDEFLEIASKYNPNIIFFNPTNPEYDSLGPDAYNIQVNWEREGLGKADIILFWVARDDKHPALTTNVEFGMWLAKSPTRIMYGRPDNAKEIKYLDWLYQTETKGQLGKYSKIYNNMERMIIDLTIGAKYYE